MEDIFISGGSKLFCPQCNKLQQFERDIPVAALPLEICCSFRSCNYKMKFAVDDLKPVIPKVDPVTHHVQGKWMVTLSENVKDYWQPIDNTTSFNERCKMIAAHIAGAMQTAQGLRSDLLHLSDAFLRQFESEWGMLNSFLKYWHPDKLDAFIKQPFTALQVPSTNKSIAFRSRLIFQPNFFTLNIGVPLKTDGGFAIQLTTPYTQITKPPEQWIRVMLGLPPDLQLQVVGDKIVGKDLFSCWRDIPGTEEDVDHLPDAPSIKFGDNHLLARQWLVSNAAPAWGIAKLTHKDCYPTAWEFFHSCPPSMKEDWSEFVQRGRLALCYANTEQAWRFALSIGAYIFGQKLVLLSSGEREEALKAVKHEAAESRANRGFHWKVITNPADLDGIPWDALSYVVLDYTDNLPPECLDILYGYKNRLVIVTDDPIMDITDNGWQAEQLFGLTSGVCCHPEAFNSSYPYNFHPSEQDLIATVLQDWKFRGVKPSSSREQPAG